ncbi:hypothetical protein FCL47_18555 [Desulfopila sp. IMCC35006]|uniref:hypothetical protein n=1 Tax=Desulfopila sp. IMCC35006 TaxID=2569542 RepID=UPI0010ACFA4E|nr:hypothetical protein [Desulfopila sp. IMCC35006]TKB24484.1 hypothetical protein FCL47_18555 [Desulfopila sp. IMCC35006]
MEFADITGIKLQELLMSAHSAVGTITAGEAMRAQNLQCREKSYPTQSAEKTPPTLSNQGGFQVGKVSFHTPFCPLPFRSLNFMMTIKNRHNLLFTG